MGIKNRFSVVLYSKKYGSWHTIYNNFRKWSQEGIIEKIFEKFTPNLEEITSNTGNICDCTVAENLIFSFIHKEYLFLLIKHMIQIKLLNILYQSLQLQ